MPYSQSTKNDRPRLKSSPPRIILGKKDNTSEPKNKVSAQSKAIIILVSLLLAPIEKANNVPPRDKWPGGAPPRPAIIFPIPVVFNSWSRSRSFLMMISRPL